MLTELIKAIMTNQLPSWIDYYLRRRDIPGPISCTNSITWFCDLL